MTIISDNRNDRSRIGKRSSFNIIVKDKHVFILICRYLYGLTQSRYLALFLCQHRLPGMRCTCYQNNHSYERLTILSKKSNAIDTTLATNSPIEVRLKRLYILYILE